MEQVTDLLKQLQEIATLAFGEYEDELIGYELGHNAYTEIIWTEEVIDAKDIERYYCKNYDITPEDIKNLLACEEEDFWCCDNTIIIAKRIKVLNKGWKTELKQIIDNL
jgi:hypothetical protein